MVLDRQKYDVSENLNDYKSNGIRYVMRENLSTQKCHIGLDARKFSTAKISTFTVLLILKSLFAKSGVLHLNDAYHSSGRAT